jgi:hypothetical protein
MIKLNKEELKRFFDLAMLRHCIYIKKEILKEDPPFTKDPIFKEFRFCNVFRKLDKTTKFIIENVIEPNEGNPNLYKAILICRFFSRIETIDYLVRNDLLFENYHITIKKLNEKYKKGEKLTTASFTLNPLKYKGEFLPKFITPFVLIKELAKFVKYDGNFDSFLILSTSLQEIFNVLVTLPSTAGFMAYEYVTDFSYSKRYFEYDPIDDMEWGNFTIGSKRGLERICKQKVSQKDIPCLTKQILKEWHLYISYLNPYSRIEKTAQSDFLNLKMREVEHWLCEYDKYMRIYKGEARRLKRRFK